MWDCKHEPDCQDQTRYDVTYDRQAVLDNEGNIVEAEPTDGKMVLAFCACCDAKATWIAQN